MAKRSILEDLQARTKAIQDEANSYIDLLAITRPKTPEKRNAELLERYANGSRRMPTIERGSDLNIINDTLERGLKDPFLKSQPVRPQDLLHRQGQEMPASAVVQSIEDAVDPYRTTPSTNIVGQTIGRLIGPPAKALGEGVGAAGRTLSQEAQKLIPINEEAIANLRPARVGSNRLNGKIGAAALLGQLETP